MLLKISIHGSYTPNYNNEPVRKNSNIGQENYYQDDSKMNANLKKKQKKLEKKLKRKMEDAYLKAYGDYLTQNGYRVKYRMDYRKIPQVILVVIVLIIIGVIIWFIPVTHNYLVQFYEENIIIHKIVDIILSL